MKPIKKEIHNKTFSYTYYQLLYIIGYKNIGSIVDDFTFNPLFECIFKSIRDNITAELGEYYRK